MSRLTDTSPEAQRVLTEAFRAMSPERKMRVIGEQYRMARALHEAGVRQRSPRATAMEVRDSWGAVLLGHAVWASVKRGAPMDQEREPGDILREVVQAFDTLGFAYAIGGSWASSLHGEPRMTRDADIMVEPFAGSEAALANLLGSDYTISIDAARTANREGSSFNIIHNPTAFKVDVFVAKDPGFERTVLARRSTATLPTSSDRPLAWVTPEDIVLLKLRWYRLGHEISDRQWSDVLGVLRVQAGRLDWSYLESWAGALGIADLLARVRSEAQV
jgi:hypothetical protein